MFRKKTKAKLQGPKLVHEFTTTVPPTKTALVLFHFSFPFLFLFFFFFFFFFFKKKKFTRDVYSES